MEVGLQEVQRRWVAGWPEGGGPESRAKPRRREGGQRKGSGGDPEKAVLDMIYMINRIFEGGGGAFGKCLSGGWRLVGMRRRGCDPSGIGWFRTGVPAVSLRSTAG